jgi:hypothetical protein
MIVAHDLDISNLTIGSTNSYNTASLLLGNLIRKTDEVPQSYIRPMKITPNRVFDYYGVDFRYLKTITYSDDVDYVFSIYNAVATQTTLTVKLAKFDKKTESWTNCGRIFIPVVTGSVATRNATSVDAKLYRYSAGTVEVNGSGVTGSGTNWADNRIFQGSRIGFGTADATQITTWYEIADVPTNSNLTLSANAIPYTASTPYVIEELKLATTFTYGTNLGLSGTALIQGVHENVFSFTGTTITPAGGTLGTAPYDDRTRSYVRLVETQTTNNFRSPGPVLFNQSINLTSSIDDYLYVFNQPSGNIIQIGRFNLGVPLTNIQTGSSFDQYELMTGLGGALATAPSRIGFFAKASHGPGSGSNDIYLVSTGRLNRTELTEIYTGSGAVATDNWFEIAPGGPSNLSTFGSANMCYIPKLDRFFLTSANSSAIFKYNIYGEEMERRVLLNSTVTNTIVSRPYPQFVYTNHATTPIVSCDNDMLYVAIGASATTNIWMNIPIGADYEYAPQTKQWAVFPKLMTPGNKLFKQALVKFSNTITTSKLGFPPERVYVFCRTTGIDDDSGEWTRLDNAGSMNAIPAAEQVQLAVAWDVLGSFALYPPVYGVTLVYENENQMPQYIPSLSLTNVTNRIFAWRQAQLFTTPTIPTLNIKLYNSETGNLILEDTTASQSQGVFEYSNDDGVTWNPWDATQNVVDNYIKYTANSLPANTLINAVITEQ